MHHFLTLFPSGSVDAFPIYFDGDQCRLDAGPISCNRLILVISVDAAPYWYPSDDCLISAAKDREMWEVKFIHSMPMRHTVFPYADDQLSYHRRVGEWLMCDVNLFILSLTLSYVPNVAIQIVTMP